MTMKEISIVFGCSERVIEICFKEYEKTNPDIKLRKTGRNYAANFTLDECIEALSCSNRFTFTPMMSRYLREHFIEHPGLQYKKENKIKISQSARSFSFFYNMYHNAEVCVTCAYFYPKQMGHKGSGLHPYCSFYECFLNKVKPYRDIYKQKCLTWIRGNKTPVIWTSVGVFEYNRIRPYNGNFKILPKDETLGIKNNKFKSKRKKGEDIVIMKDIFAQE